MIFFRLNFVGVGSSPRVWGQVISPECVNAQFGIIPTRMGTSCINSRSTFSGRDHPHAYGDKFACIRFRASCSGSSPRVWGQASSKLRKKRGKRIIPTRMGTRIFHAVPAEAEKDHPHAYGDKPHIQLMAIVL